ncbi:MAG: hypothetical protein IJO97_01010 [Lachnospiraceae bacterium]|nr:hypothetical protein [Lachnospiraceae bacterium]
MMVNGVLDSFRNSYGMQQIPVVKPQQDSIVSQEVEKEAVAVEQENGIARKQDNLHTSVPKGQKEPQKFVDLENISLTFNKEESFDYIGNDSSLDNLDMQKAVSDMQRDQILQEYQYFVGSAKDFTMQTI